MVSLDTLEQAFDVVLQHVIKVVKRRVDQIPQTFTSLTELPDILGNNWWLYPQIKALEQFRMSGDCQLTDLQVQEGLPKVRLAFYH